MIIVVEKSKWARDGFTSIPLKELMDFDLRLDMRTMEQANVLIVTDKETEQFVILKNEVTIILGIHPLEQLGIYIAGVMELE